MATVINQSKSGRPATQQELNVGSGYNLLVAAGFKLIIQAITTGTVVTNVTKS